MTRRAARPRQIRARRTGALALLLVVAGAAIVLLRGRGHAPAPRADHASTTGSSVRARRADVVSRPLTRLTELAAWSLPAPLQDAAIAASGGKAVVLGGLTAADTSTGTVLSAGANAARPL